MTILYNVRTNMIQISIFVLVFICETTSTSDHFLRDLNFKVSQLIFMTAMQVCMYICMYVCIYALERVLGRGFLPFARTQLSYSCLFVTPP